MTVENELISKYALRGLNLVMPYIVDILLEVGGFVEICANCCRIMPLLCIEVVRCLIRFEVQEIVESGIIYIFAENFGFLVSNCDDDFACLFSILIGKSNCWPQILESGILRSFCQIAIDGSFGVKISAFAVIEAAVGSNNAEFLAIIKEMEVISSICQVLEIAEKDLVGILLRVVIGLIRADNSIGVTFSSELEQIIDIWQECPDFSDLCESITMVIGSDKK
jgi:hypothetical protein